MAVSGLCCSMQDLHCCMWNLYISKRDLVSWPGIEPWPPALGVRSLSHLTTKEVPIFIFLLRYKSCTIKHTIFKCLAQWFLVYSPNWANIISVSFQNIIIIPKRNIIPISSHSQYPTSLSSWRPLITLLSMDLPVQNISYTQNHTKRGLSCLASFT